MCLSNGGTNVCRYEKTRRSRRTRRFGEREEEELRATVKDGRGRGRRGTGGPVSSNVPIEMPLRQSGILGRASGQENESPLPLAPTVSAPCFLHKRLSFDHATLPSLHVLRPPLALAAGLRSSLAPVIRVFSMGFLRRRRRQATHISFFC